jgi:hypothetical protein
MTKRKQESTKKNTRSASKKLSQSSKTKMPSSKQTKTIASAKKDLLLSDTQKKKNASSSSSVKSTDMKKNVPVLSLHDVLQNVKKRSIEDSEKGGSGFVRLTKDEFEKLKKSKFSNGMGRPPLEESEKQKVESFRFSDEEKKLLDTAAKKLGFMSWKKYVKYVAIESAKKAS